MNATSAASAAYTRLEKMVSDGIRAQEPPAPRTEAEEDQIALEWFILEHEGPESLAEYQRNPTRKPLKLRELPPHQRAIIERERADKRGFSKPAPGGVYAPRPDKDDEPDTDDNGLERDDYPTGPGYRTRHMGGF